MKKFLILVASLFVLVSCAKKDTQVKAILAERNSDNEVLVYFKTKEPKINLKDFFLVEQISKEKVKILAVSNVKSKTSKELMFYTEKLDLRKNYDLGQIYYKDGKKRTNVFELQFNDNFWSKYYSDKEMGLTINGNKYTFRVFAPRATSVKLCLFDKPYEENELKPIYEGEKQYEMVMDEKGVWELELTGNLMGKFYGYRVAGPKGKSEMFDENVLIADPYSRAVATKQTSPQRHLTVIIDPSKYNWKSTKKYVVENHNDLIVYESHIRELTMLSPDNPKKGTYEGFVEDGKVGGITHIKELGVNAVELMPIHEFMDIEIEYNKSPTGIKNTWNVYGKNYWGYMTSFYFAPESFYYKGKPEYEKWIGTDGGQVFAFKKLVDELHKNNIAVFLDVVYNHVSQYDYNALKYLDKKYYFWTDAKGQFDARSGCGNDVKTDRPMARKLIVDSVEYWVKEYRIDGYRFDLGTIIDWATYAEIKKAVYKHNSNTFLVAEPWMGGRGEPRDGGGYSPEGMAKHGIASWNDKIRELVRSRDGLIFGKADNETLKTAVKAYPKTFIEPKYSMSYIESHDNNTFSDYVRLYNGDLTEKTEIMPSEYYNKVKLTEKQMKQNKLGILFLMTVQGPIMLHQGQEFARMKVVRPPTKDDVYTTKKEGVNWKKNEKGEWVDGNDKWPSKALPYTLDHDSYEKDNETSWIDFKLKEINRELFEYYKDLIKLRKTYNKAFGNMPIDKIVFIDEKNNLKSSIGYLYRKEDSGLSKSFIILINGSHTSKASFDLPEGKWTVIVDGKSANVKNGPKLSGTVEVEPLSGMILEM